MNGWYVPQAQSLTKFHGASDEPKLFRPLAPTLTFGPQCLFPGAQWTMVK